MVAIIEEDKAMIRTKRKRQRECIGRRVRRDALLRTVLKGQMEGKKARGRLRQMFIDWMTS